MKPIPLGETATVEIMPEPHHTAAAMGNVGVEVVGTPALVGYLELASHRAIRQSCEAGEVTVGTRVEVDHLAPAFLGTPVTARAEVVAVEGRRITFRVEARQGERLVMTGRHGRAVVALARLLGKERRG
jgi:fluoroacetyl-CoA thioesterase